VALQLIPAASLLLSGLLAGAEFMVRYGVQPALSALPDRPHIQARQTLIGRLRVLVPIMMVPTLALGISFLVTGGSMAGLPFRWAGTLSLLAFALVSFIGTVPINIRVYDWNMDALPDHWRKVIQQWALIDVFRSSFAILAFLCYILALTVS